MIIISQKTTLTHDGNHKKEPRILSQAGFISSIDSWEIKTYQNTWRPPTDIIETENDVTVKVEIAGMDESDFLISLDGQKLIISGSRYAQNPVGAFYQMEILSGDFSTSVEFTPLVDTHGINAKYNNGFLTVTLKKSRA